MTKEEMKRRAEAIAIVSRNFPNVKDAARMQDDLHVLGIQCQRNAEKLYYNRQSSMHFAAMT